MKRTVLITGVAGGIGTATARMFMNLGWKVLGVDREDARISKNSMIFLKGDISDPDSLRTVFREVIDVTSNLDALINNAAIQVCKPFAEMDLTEWDLVMNSNLRSVYLVTHHALDLLRKRGGAVVNVSSVHAVATSINMSAYATSKGGLLSLTRAMAVELADEGIRVNAVLPGAIDTPMLRNGLKRWSDEGLETGSVLKQLAQCTPLKRVGKPEEVAQSIYFLADNEKSSFITGAALAVDGGALARLGTE